MDGAKGDALEWALALLHAPGKRHALRQKPLPVGMGRLLGIAAGAMPDQLAEAARTFGESEARIREAAQFYVREVLFFPRADAYRVLGVSLDASDTSIKAHHRLLQHWLHPDRLYSEDDAIFATRVNVAWNQLRNPTRRQAYDNTLQEEQPLEVFAGGDDVVSAHSWVPDVAEVPHSRRGHRLPMLALTGACILLVVLVLRDADYQQDGWEVGPLEERGIASGDGIPEISVPRKANPIVEQPMGRRVAVRLPDVERPLAVSVPAPGPNIPAIAIAPLPPPDMRHSAPHDPAIEMLAQASPPVQQAQVAAPATASGAAPPKSQPPMGRVLANAPAESSTAVLSTPTVSQEPVLPSYVRIQQAWSAGDQLLHFMGAVGRPPPPIWSSPVIQSSADLLRQDMHGAGRVRLSGSQWLIGERSAVLKSDYVSQGRGAVAGNGRLTADLVWRDGRWLVVGLSIERSQ